MSLDETSQMPEEPPSPEPRRPLGWKRLLVCVVAGILLGSAIGAAIAVTWEHFHPAKPRVTISSIGGVPVKPGQISEGNGLMTWQSATYSDGTPVGDDDLQRIILDAIKNVDNLKGWQICGDELRADADAIANGDAAAAKFPHDLPFNRSPDAKWLQSHASYVQGLRAAAPLADSNHIACAVGPTTDKFHVLSLTVQVDGARKTALVSDMDVLQDVHPLEFYDFSNDCASKLQQHRDKLAATPVDSHVLKDDPWDTLSETIKARDLADYDAEIALLKQHPLPNC